MVTNLSSVAMVTLGRTLKEKCSGMQNEDSEHHFVSVSKEEVQKLPVKFVPKNTKKNTNWAVKNFTKWRDYHNITTLKTSARKPPGSS